MKGVDKSCGVSFFLGSVQNKTNREINHLTQNISALIITRFKMNFHYIFINY